MGMAFCVENRVKLRLYGVRFWVCPFKSFGKYYSPSFCTWLSLALGFYITIFQIESKGRLKLVKRRDVALKYYYKIRINFFTYI